MEKKRQINVISDLATSAATRLNVFVRLEENGTLLKLQITFVGAFLAIYRLCIRRVGCLFACVSVP